jgi:hypothetical protein
MAFWDSFYDFSRSDQTNQKKSLSVLIETQLSIKKYISGTAK